MFTTRNRVLEDFSYLFFSFYNTSVSVIGYFDYLLGRCRINHDIPIKWAKSTGWRLIIAGGKKMHATVPRSLSLVPLLTRPHTPCYPGGAFPDGEGQAHGFSPPTENQGRVFSGTWSFPSSILMWRLEQLII